MARILFILQILVVIDFVAAAIVAPNATTGTVCTSMACVQRARWMAEAMDTDVSPCEDFYQFACGGWHLRHRVPSSKPSYSTSMEANDRIHDQIDGLLASATGRHPSAVVRLAGWLYQRCLEANDDEQPEPAVTRPVTDWAQVFLANWRAGRVLTQPVLFGLSVTSNPTNTSENILVLEPAELALPDDELIRCSNRSRLMRAYRQYLAHLLSDANQLDQIVGWECQLAAAKMAIRDQRQPSNVINLVDFEQLQNLTGFDWLNQLIRPMWRAFELGELPPEATRKQILVTDLEYFGQLGRLLAEARPSTVATYWELAAAMQTAPYQSERARRQLYTFLKVKTGARQTPGRWRTCYSLVEEMVPWALSRLFVQHQFEDDEAVPLAGHIVDRVHGAFADTVRDSIWLDELARNRSLQKLDLIRKNVAYPNWLLRDDRLDDFYHWRDDIPMAERGSLVATLDRFRWRQMQANLARINRTNDDDEAQDDWPMEPSRLNAAYSPEDNTITIPAGILTRPYFEPELPLSLNYGGIGTVVGHELSHSLDDEGRQFDHRGNFAPLWWPAHMVQHFGQHSSCLVGQYGRIQEPATGLRLDGLNTLGENIADNGGLRAAFRAMQRHLDQISESERLPGPLTRFTSEQLFFLANAQIWCSMSRVETLRNKIQYDRHVPPRYRVNVPAANFDQFSRAFRCPVGAPMNPATKCVLWT